jgi:hypothetical protein
MKKTIGKIILVLMSLFILNGCDLEDYLDQGGGSNDSKFKDDIPASEVIFLDARDVQNWAVTSDLNASTTRIMLNIPYSQANQWPAHPTVKARDGSPMNANAWILDNINGQWYAATFEYLKVNQQSKPLAVITGAGGHITQAPMTSFKGESGKQYAVMVSTFARNGLRTINERSEIKFITWP